MSRTTQSATIMPSQRLVSANYKSGTEIPTYDDAFGPLFISRNSLGVNGIVRARNWHEAYEICEDEFFPEADETIDELVKEYGDDWTEDACFQEGFGFRPNGPNKRDKQNHGIYSKDLNGDFLDRLTDEMLQDLGIVLEVEEWEEEEEEV